MTPQSPHPSESWLRRFARIIFDDDTMTRVIDPTLADLDHEVVEAGDDPIARRSARLRGYVAFWKLVVLSPFVFADWPGRRQFAQSLTHVSAIVVLLVVTFGAESEWMTRLLVAFVPPILERVYSVADLAPWVWMLIPIAVLLLAALGRRSPFRVAPTAVLMVCGATVAASAAYGAAGFVATFDAVGRTGSASFGILVHAMGALALPSLFALLTTATTMIVIAVSQWRALRVVDSIEAQAARLSGTVVVVMVVSMAAALVAANQWMLFNEELLDLGLAMSNPARSAAAGGGIALAGRSELAIPVMILGFIIAVTMLVAAFAAWRGALTRRPNALLVWSTRLAVVAMLAGCVWHASVIGGQWRTFTTEANAMRASAAPSR